MQAFHEPSPAASKGAHQKEAQPESEMELDSKDPNHECEHTYYGFACDAATPTPARVVLNGSFLEQKAPVEHS